MRKRRFVISAAAAVAAAMLAACSSAAHGGGGSSGTAAFPTKPITIIVPRGAGGADDLIARRIAPYLAKELGTKVAVEDMEGGGGVSGLTYVHNQPANGYTLVTWSPPGEYIMQVEGLLPFPASDFTMLGATSDDPALIAVPLNSPYKSIGDLIAASRASAKPFTVATTDVAGASALSVLQYETAFGVKWQVVPYGSGADATTAILGGKVTLGVRSGGLYDLNGSKLRVLSQATTTPVSQAPGVPSLYTATNLSPDKYNILGAVRGLAVLSNTPPAVISKLSKALAAVTADPAFSDSFYKDLGFIPAQMDSAAANQYLSMAYSVVNKYQATLKKNSNE